MKKYYTGTKAVLLAGAILMAVLFVIALFSLPTNWFEASVCLCMTAMFLFYRNDIVKAERWYECMNDYWDTIKKQEEVIDAYKDLDNISDNALKLARECNDSNRTYLSTLSEMNKLANFFLDGIDDEAALAVNEEMKETNLYLRKIYGKWVLCCRKPW